MPFLRSRRSRKENGNVGDAVSADKSDGHFAGVAIGAGRAFVRKAIKQGLGMHAIESKPAHLSPAQALVHASLLRFATRSIPGAILVGGGLISKALYDRRKARRAREDKGQGHDNHAGDSEQA